MAGMDDGQIINPDMEEWTVGTSPDGCANELSLPPIPNLRIRRPNQPKEAKGKS